MNEKVKAFLESKKEAKNKKEEYDRAKNLIELGLFEKVYAPDNKYSDEFCYSEWDTNSSASKYYKKVPVEISDEDYNEVLKYSNNENSSDTNSVAFALTVIAVIEYIVGFIAFLPLASYNDVLSSIIVLCAALISGTVFLGFAEIIKLLTAIKHRLI